MTEKGWCFTCICISSCCRLHESSLTALQDNGATGLTGVKPSPARRRMARDQTRDDHERCLGLSGELTLKRRRDLRFLDAIRRPANGSDQNSGSAETSEIASHLPPVGVKWKVSICSPGISLALSIQNPRSLPTLTLAIPPLVQLSAVVFASKKPLCFHAR